MGDEEKQAAESEVSHKDLLAQDLKIVDQMTRWRQKISRGENIKVKILDKGMMPAIKIGDVAEIQPIQAMNLKTGNIIFYRQGENFLARRIIEVSFKKGGEFTAKGDALEKPEPTVNAGQIIGKIISLERDGEKVDVQKRFGGDALKQLKKLGSMEVGPKQDYTKQKDMMNAGLSKTFEFIEIAYQKLCQATDKLLELIFRKTR